MRMFRALFDPLLGSLSMIMLWPHAEESVLPRSPLAAFGTCPPKR